MEGPPLGPGAEDITWPDQVAPRGRKASSTRKTKLQASKPSHGGFFDQGIPEEVFGGLVCVAVGWPSFVLS